VVSFAVPSPLKSLVAVFRVFDFSGTGSLTGSDMGVMLTTIVTALKLISGGTAYQSIPVSAIEEVCAVVSSLYLHRFTVHAPHHHLTCVRNLIH